MRSMMLAVLMAFVCSTALAQDSNSAIGNETTTADQAQDKAETTTAADAKEPEPFKVPAGYRTKKRGDKVVYCKKVTEPGTRFSSEQCYDETRLRAMEMAREQEQATFDQSRKICSNLDACGGG